MNRDPYTEALERRIDELEHQLWKTEKRLAEVEREAAAGREMYRSLSRVAERIESEWYSR